MNDLNPFGGLVMAGIFSAAGCLLILVARRGQPTGFSLVLFLTACAVRFAASLAIYTGGLLTILHDEDSSGWVIGRDMAVAWKEQGLGLLDIPAIVSHMYASGNRGFDYLIAASFTLSGVSGRLPLAALNGVIGALAAVLTYWTAQRLSSEMAARRVGWWVCFLPLMIVWSAQTIKEPLIFLLSAAALYGCVRLNLPGAAIRHWVSSLFAFFLVVPVRFYLCYAMGAMIIASLLSPLVRRHPVTAVSMLARAAVIVIVVTTIVLATQHWRRLENFNLGRIENFRSVVALGGSGVRSQSLELSDDPSALRTSPPGTEPASNLRILARLPMTTLVGALSLLLAPFPWQFIGGSWRLVLTAPDVMVWWWLFFARVGPGVWRSVRQRAWDVQPLLTFLFLVGLLYSVLFANVGIAYRQRAQLLPAMLILAAAGLDPRAPVSTRRAVS